MSRIVLATACLLLFMLAFSPGRGAADDGQRVQTIEAVASGATERSLVVRGPERWYLPLAIYPSTSLIGVGMPVDAALRLPAVVAAGFVIVLTALVAARLVGHGSAREGVLMLTAALLLLTAPALLNASRAGDAGLLTVACVLAWVWTLLRLTQRPRPWLAMAGGAMLAVSAYTHPVGVLAVPIYFAVGAAVLVGIGHAARTLAFAAVGVMATVAPLVAWVVLHPSAYAETFGRWAIHAAHIRSPWDGLVAGTRWHVLGGRSGAYWDFFNPTRLFATGDGLGVVMLALAPVGVWLTIRRHVTREDALMLGGALAAPVPAILLNEPQAVESLLILLPFATLTAVLAAQRALTLISQRAGWRTP